MAAKQDDYFGLWFPMGAILGCVAATLGFSAWGIREFSDWLYRYQTLTSAAIALVAAWYTVRATLYSTELQIQHSRDLSELSRVERHRAARAILPFRLTEIVEYCKSSVLELIYLLEFVEGKYPDNSGSLLFVHSGSFEAKQFPSVVFEGIRDVIETAPSEVARELGILLTDIQICSSRLNGLQNEAGERKPTVHEIRHHMIDVCDLYARTCRYYDYGRFKSEKVIDGEMTEKEIRSAARLLKVDIDDPEFSRVILTIYPKP